MSILQGNVSISGHFSARSMSIPPNSIGNEQLRPDAAIDATKVDSQYSITHTLSNHATAAVVKREIIHIVQGLSGGVISFSIVASVAPTTTDTVTVNLLKNGTSILTAPVVLNNSNANFNVKDGIVSVAGLAQGDVLEVDVSGVTGTSCKGLAVRLVVREKPQ